MNYGPRVGKIINLLKIAKEKESKGDNKENEINNTKLATKENEIINTSTKLVIKEKETDSKEKDNIEQGHNTTNSAVVLPSNLCSDLEPIYLVQDVDILSINDFIFENEQNGQTVYNVNKINKSPEEQNETDNKDKELEQSDNTTAVVMPLSSCSNIQPAEIVIQDLGNTIDDISEECNKEISPITNLESQLIRVESPIEVSEDLKVRKRKKRRLVNKNEWLERSNKIQRETGKEYLGKRKQDLKWEYSVKKSAKKIKGRCNCNGKHVTKCNQISNEEREELFEVFWKLDWAEKKIYLTTLVDKITTNRARNRKNEHESRREFSYKYYLKAKEKIRVCKTMFCNTFGIPPRTIGHWLLNDSQEIKKIISEENNSEMEAEADTTLSLKSTKYNERRMCLKKFFENLPKLESHYCRKSSSKLYLEPNWISKSSLYHFYKYDFCKEREILPLSYPVFSDVFDDLNLSLFSPKKDQCDVCTSYATKNLNEATYQSHLAKKEEARAEKECDKSAENKIVFTMDLQSVLLCPKSNVSSLYYKTKLIVHNFTLFNLKSKKGYCYLWHEGEAGLTSCVFASIIYYHLLTHVIGSDETAALPVILYSDGCTCQNRNAILSNALVNLAQEKHITVEQKYLEKGHTQMECDSMHSTIERKLRNKIINVPADYVEICKTARRNPEPYIVQYLDHTFFKNFEVLKYIPSIRPGRVTGEATVTDIRALKYQSDGSVLFKISHRDEWKPLPFRASTKKGSVIAYHELPNLYANPLPIKAEKYQHLMSLKGTMPKDYHSFYDGLHHL